MRVAPLAVLTVVLTSACSHSQASPASPAPAPPAEAPRVSCFLLYEMGVGEVRRSPSEGCASRMTPASTFKIPHDDVRWLVGHLQRGDRAWVFVSCAGGDELDPMAAIELAARSLRDAHVL
jgi:beta-lactamase class D